MSRRARTERRIKAIRAMFKPLRDARLKREKRAAEAIARQLEHDMRFSRAV